MPRAATKTAPKQPELVRDIPPKGRNTKGRKGKTSLKRKVRDDFLKTLAEKVAGSWDEIVDRWIEDAKKGDRDARRDLLRAIFEGKSDDLLRIFADERDTEQRIKEHKQALLDSR